MRSQTLFVGLGSSHGDDQIGWRVAEQLESQVGSSAVVYRAAAPGEVLNWLANVKRLELCDACVADVPAGTLLQWTWPCSAIRPGAFSGSHDLPLTIVLQLAAQLGILPQWVTVWGVAIGDTNPGGGLSPALEAALPAIVKRIAGELSHA